MEEQLTPEQSLDKATKLGYDADRYDRTDPRWKSPEDFLDFGERLNPILRENNKRLEAQLAARDAQIVAIQAEVAKFAKAHEETAKAAYAKALTALKEEKKAALEIGDYDTVVEVDERIADTKAAEKAATAPTPAANTIPQQVEVAYKTWATNNEWIKDPELEAYARAEGEILVRKGTIATGEHFIPFLDQVAERVKSRFPEKFENEQRSAPSRVEGASSGSSASSSASGRTYSKLPQEAKEACDLLIKTIPGFTKEKYVSSYKW